MKKYKWIRGIKKGLLAAAAVGAGLVAGTEALAGLSVAQEVSAVTGVSALVMAIRTGLNWWKVNKDLADQRFVR